MQMLLQTVGCLDIASCIAMDAFWLLAVVVGTLLIALEINRDLTEPFWLSGGTPQYLKEDCTDSMKCCWGHLCISKDSEIEALS
jgi:hypothetical protein